MSFTNQRVRIGLASLGLMAGCSAPPPPAPADNRAAPTTAPAGPSAIAALPLPPPGPVRNWAEVRLQAARRLVAANPNGTYMGPAPDVLLGIPVLEIELNGDGSVRKVVFLRKTSDTFSSSNLVLAC